MNVEEGRVLFNNAKGDGLGTQRYTLQQRRKLSSYRIRLSAVSIIFGCLCGGFVLQQFSLLRKLVPENVEESRLLLAPFEQSTSRRRYDERKTLKFLNSTQWIQDSKEDSIDGGFDEIEGKAFLVFQFPNHSGQGTGNIMSGALAAQLLAEEFNRTLCHTGAELSSVHASFRKAFDWIDVSHQEFCERIIARDKETTLAFAPNPSKTIVQRNYDQTSEQCECNLREMLANHTENPIVYYQGNTYPRWPNEAVSSPRDYFHEKFKPTEALREVLPWKLSAPPPIIIHLRDGDDERDLRGGLDDLTLSRLAKKTFLDDSDSSHSIFLVTNNVEWYSRFPDWSHPGWSSVHHSALRRIFWGRTNNGKKDSHTHQAKGDGDLQMWSDWYTLLNAKKIYHTFSDFSRSASRWNQNIKSWTILGSTNQTLDRKDGKVEAHILLRNDLENLTHGSKVNVSRLVDRDTKELWFCDSKSLEEKKHVQEKRERQLLDLLRARKHRGA